MFKKFLILSICLVLNVACKPDEKAIAAAVAAIALTNSQIAGNLSTACITGPGNGHIGTTSRKQGYTLQANGNYNYSLTVFNSPNCASGSVQSIKYTQFGTYTITGISASGTTVAFTIGSMVLSSDDSAYRSYFNDTSLCGTASLNLVGSSNGTVSPSGRTCSVYTTFPTTLSTYYNIFTMSGNTISAYSPSWLWYAGVPTSYPTSTNTTYTYY